MSVFDQLRADSMQTFIDGRKQGLKIVGAYCTYFPQELALAAGAVPVSLAAQKKIPSRRPRNICLATFAP